MNWQLRVKSVLGLWCGLTGAAMPAVGGAHAQAEEHASLVSPPTPALVQRLVDLDVQSGDHFYRGGGNGAAVVWTETIRIPDAAWIRLKFSDLQLARDFQDQRSAFLRFTSLEDGAVQELDALAARQWRFSTAYFNGNSVRVELIAFPSEIASRVQFDFAWAGRRNGQNNWSQCGPTDDRLPSDDSRSARGMPVGCTVFMIDDFNHCFLSAGHCASGGNLDVAQFNVPPSDSEGNVRHPGPEDQYAVDETSIQFTNGGIGNDWTYFGCFENSNTGLTPYEAQGAFYGTAKTPPPVQGQDIRITGYGVDNTPPSRNQTQQTHAGPYVNVNGTQLQYQTDTQGGNSGSGVQDDSTGLIVGIHTHGGCNTNGTGANSGTAIDNAGLRNALANPRGVCRPLGLVFDFPDGLPRVLDPSGDSVLVTITPEEGVELDSSSAKLHYDNGGGYSSVSMIDLGGGFFEANFPAMTCGTDTRFYFSAMSMDGREFTDPFNAPTTAYLALVAAGVDEVVSDDFETDLGWTVENIDLTDGAWVRGVPAGGGDRGDPPTDFDGSGRCYLTDNVAGNSDVDGGPTRLISPIFDLSSLVDPRIGYARWFTNDDNDQDRLDVHLSNDGGSSWTLVESVAHSEGWSQFAFRVADFLTPTDQMRVRFSATDNPNNSVTEAAIDAFQILDVLCADTELTDFSVTTGTLLEGDLESLRTSDDNRVRARSGFGRTLVDLHNMTMIVGARSSVQNASTVDLSVETRLNHPVGTMQIRLKNWNTAEFDLVGTQAINDIEQVFVVTNIDASAYVQPGSGDIEIEIKQIVFVPQFAFLFESWIDCVQVTVQ